VYQRLLQPFALELHVSEVIAVHNYDLNHMPGFMEGDIVISNRYPDPYDTFSCYGYTYNRNISNTTIYRDGEVIYSGTVREGYCVQR